MKATIWIFLTTAVFLAGCKKDKQPAAAVLTTAAATNITSSGVTTGGNISSDGGSAVTRRGVCWALHANPTLTDSITSNGTGSGSFSVTLANLSGNAIYYIRAYAINGISTSYGSQVTFTTAKGTATVVTTVAGAVNPTNASTASGGNVTNDGGANITARGVCFSTSPHPTLSSTITTDGAGTGLFTSTLTPLLSSTLYYYRAYAINSYGTAYGNELSFTAGSTNTVADADGNIYYTITIGTQTWTTSNLRVTHYQNGDPITNGSTVANLDVAAQGSSLYLFPNGDTTNKKTYGLYYSVSAVKDSRNIAPNGWHVSTDQDWYTLEFYEGMTAADTTLQPLNGGTRDDGVRGNFGGKLLQGGSSGLNLQLAGYYCPGCGGYSGFGTGGLGLFLTPQTAIAPVEVWSRIFNSAAPDTGPVWRYDSSLPSSVRLVHN
jgi:hypothetical protein